MPITITDPELERDLFLNGIKIAIREWMPDDAIMLLGPNSASILMNGQTRSFRWNVARMYPHGHIVFEGFEEVKE